MVKLSIMLSPASRILNNSRTFYTTLILAVLNFTITQESDFLQSYFPIHFLTPRRFLTELLHSHTLVLVSVSYYFQQKTPSLPFIEKGNFKINIDSKQYYTLKKTFPFLL